MEDKIIALLTQDKRAFSVYELNDFLGFKTADELKELLKVLNHLEDNLQVYRTNKDKYMLFNNSNLKIGRMIANKKGFGFVDIEGTEDVFIPPMYMNGAIHNDKVIVEIISKKGIELEGRITKIVDRNLKYMVGEISHRNGKCLIKLDDDKIKLDIYLDKLASRDVVDGHKVLVKLTNKLKANSYKGEIIKILGHKNDPGVDILSIVNQLGIPDTFSDEVLSETDCLPDCVLTNELLNRRDLRNEEIFTIDGDDTKDIDDAISIKKMENGYQLGVHIADVSYYVTANSKIDEEAYLRGTSVYLVDRVIPMLPHKLSNGICSLNPNVDRLAISCVMDIDNKGNVINYEIFESVISSKKQMTYNCVNEIYDNNYITKGYEPFVNSLNLMRDLSNILRKSKIERGYIDFDLDESKILIGVDGNVTDVVLRDRGIGQKVIEDFMIIANETVATHISNMELPFIYRVHGQPNENKISEFLRFVSLFGYNINTKLKEIRPKDMQLILDELKDTKEFHIFSKLLLRSMQKAIYDYKNIGHFGLASICYTHFTSPIRRYPDTTVHRLLRTYLFKNDQSIDTVKYWEHKMPIIAEQTSKMERLSIECEREVDDMKKAEYMMQHIGEEFTGMISGVMSFGVFVQLPNLIEGLVKPDSIKGDHYSYDETTFSLRGIKDKRGFRLGDMVCVKVIRACKETKTIDFEIVR